MTNGRQVRLVECCMLLFRTANVVIGTEAEARGVASVFQSPSRPGNVLIATIGLPSPQTLGGERYVAWIRGTPNSQVIPVQLLQTGPVITEPGVYVGALVFGPGEPAAPFNDIVVTAEGQPPFIQPSLNRIVLIGLFNQCHS